MRRGVEMEPSLRHKVFLWPDFSAINPANALEILAELLAFATTMGAVTAVLDRASTLP